MTLAGVDSAHTVMVGDSAIDLRTARAAGTRLCIVRYGFGFDLAAPELRDGDGVAGAASELPGLLAVS